MSTRLAVSAVAFLAFLGACDASITEPYTDRLNSVVVGSSFSCGLTGEGIALCWGEASNGQLGDGTGLAHAGPVPVASGARFTQLVAGGSHTCGLAGDGRAFCWGDNHDAQLGQVDTDLSCVLRQSNGWDQDFGNACSTAPVPLESDLRFKSLGAGAAHTCGLTSGGEIWCWGSAFYPLGQVGEVSISASAAPVKVIATAHFKAIAIGTYHACAVDDEGLGWCWGSGWNGQTGLGAADSLDPYRAAPARIASPASLRAVTVGNAHSCALTNTGEILCWGAGSQGQRGDSTFGQSRHTPTLVKTDRAFSAVVAGQDRTCAIESGTRAAWCWGDNGNGSLGVGVAGFDQLAPAAVLGGMSYSRLSLTRSYSASAAPPICGTAGDGIYCWGQLPQPLTFEE